MAEAPEAPKAPIAGRGVRARMGSLAPRGRRGAVVAAGSILGSVLMVALALTIGLVGAGATSQDFPFVVEPFTNSALLVPSDWKLPALPAGVTGTNVACLTASKATTKTATNPIPGCTKTKATASGTGALRLTKAVTTEDGGVAFTTAVPSGDGLDINFDTFQYGGTGADGIMFFLAGANPANPKPPATLGPPGGHLGYSGSTAGPAGTGLADGYLGIGFDVFGNFENKTFDGSGCALPSWATGKDPEQVTVRGPGTGKKGYCLLSSTEASGGMKGTLTGGKTGTLAGSEVPAEIAINPTSAQLTTPSGIKVPARSYVVSFTPLKAAKQTITGTLPSDSYLLANDPSWVTSSTGIPKQFAFGFAGSTGASTDIHELRDVSVGPMSTNPPRFGLSLSDSADGVLVKTRTVTYTATPSLSSTGGSVGNDPTLTVTFPAGITPTTASGTDWSCKVKTQVATCTWTGPLPIKSTSAFPSVKVKATIKSTATTGSKTVTSSLSVVGAEEASATDVGTVEAAKTKAVLGLTLTDSANGSLVQGSSVTYTATGSVSNAGAAVTVAPKFTDTFPTGLTPSTAVGTTWNCKITGQKITCTWTGGKITPGRTLPAISIKVNVGVFATGALDDTGVLTTSSATPASVKAKDTATIVSIPVYKLTLASSPVGTFTSAGTVIYTAGASLTATGGSETDAPTITDNFPADFTTITKTAADTKWTCVQSGTKGTGFTEACKWTGGNLAAGATLQTLVFKAKLKTLTAGTAVDTTASISSNDAATVSTSNYAAIGKTPAPNLGVSASAPPVASVGTTYTLTLHASVLATGGKATHNPVLTATLPTGEKYSSTPVGTHLTCSLSTGTRKLSCTYKTAPIAKGTSLPVILAQVHATAAGNYTTQVKITDTTDKASPASTSASTDVTTAPVLALGLSGTPAQAEVGTSYTLTVSPSISGTATHHPKLVVTLQAGQKFAAKPTPTGWTCALSNGTRTLTCTATVTSGLSAVVVKVDNLATATPGLRVTTATLSDTGDAATTVTKTAKVTVTGVPTLGLAVSPAVTHASAGTTYTLTLAPSVTGTAYHDPTLTVTLPAGEKFTGAPTLATWTCTVSATGLTLTCTSKRLSSLEAVKATVKITAGTTGTHQATATLSDATDAAVPVTKPAKATVTPDPVLTVTSTGTPAHASVGTTYTLVLHGALTTAGPAYHDPAVTATLPAGEVFTGPPRRPAGHAAHPRQGAPC